ncbi:CFEM domain-containing protein [Stachybotrys elegans]|uniref:CFEM domain-containing protein n=1 Tax=Stachybotrys elegans TaxID=80388 RepID=A0A8K0SNN1_9HYPO|nr:CFEM domain-containing protein [Stachybotrys elegans]
MLQQALRSSLLLLLALCFLRTVQAAEAPASGGLPPCATSCFAEALGTGYCSMTNVTCICTNDEFKNVMGACIVQQCTIAEALSAQGSSAGMCGTPVRDRSASYTAISITMITLGSACVVLRFLYKLLNKLPLGLDDWFILATLGCSIASAVMTVQGAVAHGLGRDIWTLSAGQITTTLSYFYHLTWVYFLEVTLTKLSFISFYIRIFTTRGVQRLLWGTFIFTTLWGCACTLAVALECQPISYFWTRWDGLHEGKCVNVNILGQLNAGSNIILDVWVLVVPLWQLRGLQLDWKKKLGVSLMFSTGLFVTIVSILRLRTLFSLQSSTNPTYDFYSVTLWSTLEVTAGIICACLPAIRHVLILIFPVLGNITSKGRPYYISNAKSKNPHANGSTNSRIPARTVGTVSVTPRGSGPDVSTEGISVETAYDVQFSDQVHLIEMNRLASEK